jgi:hypothetical protein
MIIIFVDFDKFSAIFFLEKSFLHKLPSSILCNKYQGPRYVYTYVCSYVKCKKA